MPKHTIVAQFHDYGAAHRAFCELLTGGVEPHDISLIAGDRSNRYGANRDFGILAEHADDYAAEVRRGRTLLAVRLDERDRGAVAEIIEEHAPIETAERFAAHAAAGSPDRSRRNERF